MWSTTGTVREAMHVLMAGVPYGADADELLRRLQAIPHVIDVHDLHVWTLVGNKINMWAHLTVDADANHTQVHVQSSGQGHNDQPPTACNP